MSKMKKFFLSLAVLIIASVHIVWAQKVLIYKSDGTTIEYKVSTLDSMVFVKEKQTMPSHLTCPDDHHPHAIDLGLASGTKWCCCNVGASKPEEYGGCYAWGETLTKSVYTEVTYRYCTGKDTGKDTDGDGWYDNGSVFVNIGSDIAGTEYDAATVNMGAPWRMPSDELLTELVNNCSRQWAQVNGVNGILVTGRNDGQIFLPAAGYRWLHGFYLAGSNGYYWSSQLRSSKSVRRLHFGSDYWYFGNDPLLRIGGHSVRAVCP